MAAFEECVYRLFIHRREHLRPTVYVAILAKIAPRSVLTC